MSPLIWLCLLVLVGLVLIGLGLVRGRSVRFRAADRRRQQAIQLQQIRAERAILELTQDAVQQMLEAVRPR
jgi:hypothetical protein